MPVETKLQYPRSTRLWKATSWAAIGTVGLISKFWLEWLSRFHCHNREALYRALDRDKFVPLITVANHTSCVDDPCLFGCLPLRFLVGTSNVRRLRWSLGATDICFTSNTHAVFFLMGKTVPCTRGEGVYQRTMDYVLNKLNQGDWVHVFPEGKVNMFNETLRLKWGVGRLIGDCQKLPIVLPMWHCGMQDVLPNKPPYYPQIRKYVTLYIGEPIDFSKQLQSLRDAQKSSREIRKAITDVIEAELASLKERAEEMHKKRQNGQFRPEDS